MSPLQCFAILQKNGYSKTPQGLLLHFSAVCDLPETKKYFEKKFQKKLGFLFPFFSHAGTVEENTLNFEILLLFWSLRYGADLGRSRSVCPCESIFHFWERLSPIL